MAKLEESSHFRDNANLIGKISKKIQGAIGENICYQIIANGNSQARKGLFYFYLRE